MMTKRQSTTRKRQRRRAEGLCATCGVSSESYRCPECAAKQKALKTAQDRPPALTTGRMELITQVLCSWKPRERR